MSRGAFEILFLFLILLLGSILCSLLGGCQLSEGFSGNISGNIKITGDDNLMKSTSGASTASSNVYDTYNHYTGVNTKLPCGTTFYGDNGRTAIVEANSDGTQLLNILLPDSTSPVKFMPKNKLPSANMLPRKVVDFTGERKVIETYYGPSGQVASILDIGNGQRAVEVSTLSGTYFYNPSGLMSNSTKYYGSTGNSLLRGQYTMAYDASSNQTPGNINVNFINALPKGIPRSQIPPGDEHLYILKSEVVPPVCPVCPTYPRQEPCPPCPACARCPEPQFTCKKVPNYSASNKDLPYPVVSSNAQFGM